MFQNEERFPPISSSDHSKSASEKDTSTIKGKDASITETKLFSSNSNRPLQTDNLNNSLSHSKFQYYLSNPFLVLFASFLLAWIYTMIPDTNYWVYYLIKNQFWATMTLIECLELLTINIPDVKDTSYFLSYLIGFCLPIVIHTIAFYLGASIRNNIYLSSLSVVTTVLGMFIIYGIDCFIYPDVNPDRYKGHPSSMKYRVFRSNTATPPVTDQHEEPPRYTQTNKTNPITRLDSIFDVHKKYRTIFLAIGDTYSFSSNPSIHRVPTSLPTQKESIVSSHEIELSSQESISNPLQQSTTESSIHQINNNQIMVSQKNPSLLSSLRKYKYYFPRYWNPTHWKEMNQLRNYDRRIIWFYSTIYSIIFCTNYIFLIILTINFHEDASLQQGISLILIFLFGTTIFRLALKYVGSILDSMKQRSISMYFIAEVACLLFYYTFYRVLFRSINNLEEFFIFQIFHLSSEWFLYVIRTTSWFYHWTEWLILSYEEKKEWWWFSSWFRHLIQKPRFSFHDWQKLMTLDFSIRFVVLISSTYSIILLFVTIQYIPWVRNDLQDESMESFQFTMILLCAALVLEVLNAWIMNEVHFKPNHLDVRKELTACFQNVSFGILSLFIGVNLLINPVFAFSNTTQF